MVGLKSGHTEIKYVGQINFSSADESHVCGLVFSTQVEIENASINCADLIVKKIKPHYRALASNFLPVTSVSPKRTASSDTNLKLGSSPPHPDLDRDFRVFLNA